MQQALSLVNAIAANAQIAVRQSKAAIRRGLQTDITTGTAYESEAFALCFATEDQKDAMAAFVRKEKHTAVNYPGAEAPGLRRLYKRGASIFPLT